MIRSILPSVLISVALAGCNADDSQAAEVDASTSSTSSLSSSSESSAETSGPLPTSTGMQIGSSSGLPDIDALYDCEDPAFTELGPLAGPGYDPGAGLLEPLQDEYVVHTTQLLVKPDKQDQFLALVGDIQVQLSQTPGLVAVAFASEPTCGFARTLGVWRSEAEMFAFVAGEAHAKAMGQSLEISITGKTAHWTATADEVPVTWERAIEELGKVEASPVYD